MSLGKNEDKRLKNQYNGLHAKITSWKLEKCQE